MKTYATWISAPFPEISARRVEVQSNSAEHAELLIRARFPGSGYSKPRDVAPEQEEVTTDWALFHASITAITRRALRGRQ
jgi:hypothetical protein